MGEPAGDPFSALGDPHRRAILSLLGAQDLSVQQIAAGLPISRPAVSRHLRVLKDAGLVSDRSQGTRRLYRVDPRGLAELRSYLEGFWEAALADLAAAAETEEDEP